MLNQVEADLKAAFDPVLVDELLEAFSEAKRNYYLGGDRLSAVEGGRFCEAAFRMLEQQHAGAFVPLGKPLDTEKLIRQVESNVGLPDSMRIHIPRSLRVVYDIRNQRDNAHLADGIDPNVQDSTLVVGMLDWVLAEFVRLFHSVPPDAAQVIVDQLAERAVPVVQEFDGFLKVLTALPASRHVLVLLYQCGPRGATFEQLVAWAAPSMRGNLKRTLAQLVDDKRYVHHDGSSYVITASGAREVEEQGLLHW